MKIINGFQGGYRWLSNFWPCTIVYEKIIYPTTEHAYQAAKVSGASTKIKISQCAAPSDAKEYFAQNNISPDPGWTVQKKIFIMEELLRKKFDGHEPLLTQALLATGNSVLVEDNSWGDTFWGVCNGTGENHLGKLIMQIREELLQQKEQIFQQVKLNIPNEIIAAVMRITERELYEKMNAFSIANEKWWIS